MRPAETIASLASFEDRGGGTDAERRAGRWLTTQLSSLRRVAWPEPFWCRPNWALTHAWHSVVGLAGSLLAVSEPRVGGALVLIALLSLLADAVTGASLGRLLTPERASQNIVYGRDDEQRVRLIITANYDVGRAGLVYRDRLRSTAAWLAGITANLISSGKYLDVAARDANMAVAAFVLARLCERERRAQMRIPEQWSRAA